MTSSQLKHLQAIGKIRSFRPVFKESDTKPKNNLPATKRSEEKSWLEWNLMYFCNEHSLELIQEYQFDKTRRWRADFAIPAPRIILEYEGIMSAKSRHTTVTGYSNDSQKYNAAVKLGWKVLRYDVFTYRNAIQDLKEIIKSK